MNTTTKEFKSPLGYHPCNYEMFLKLKRLHKWYWQTLYDFHRWHRWWRKEPQNRIGSEPKFCPSFVEDKVWRKAVRIHGEVGVKVYPKTVTSRGMMHLYQTARMPQAEPVQPLEAETKQRIESLYEQVRTYFHG